MSRDPSPRPLRLASAIVLGVLTVAALDASPVAAHNSLSSSTPADGAVLTVAPSEIVWTFANEVPLDSLTVTLIDQTMVRTELTGSRHGGAGTMEVVTPLPALGDGEISVRWRLVSPDGHVVSGRVGLTIDTASGAAPDTTPPPTTVAGSATSTDDGGSVSSPIRWGMRYGSYLAIMAAVGILAMSAWVWPGAMGEPRLRSILAGALVTTAALGLAQLVLLAADITGESLLAAVGSVDAAMSIDAGRALALRVALAGALLLVIFFQRIESREIFWTAAGIPVVGLLATWAFAGHAASMRWPTVGVTADVVHHAAAALWFVGLAVVALIVIPSRQPAMIAAVVRRFSGVAATCVGVLVATGVIQSMRLVGSPLDIWSVDHGRYLVVKVGLFGLMLAAAAVNRRRVAAAIGDDAHLMRDLGTLRRAVLVEFAIGLAIVGLTAVMVVTPPATAAG